MKKVIKLKESDLINIIKKVVSEQTKSMSTTTTTTTKLGDCPGHRCAGGCCKEGEMCNPQTGYCYIQATRKP